jgi:hypothetical protein
LGGGILIVVGVRNRIRVGGETAAERRGEARKEEESEMGFAPGYRVQQFPGSVRLESSGHFVYPDFSEPILETDKGSPDVAALDLESLTCGSHLNLGPLAGKVRVRDVSASNIFPHNMCRFLIPKQQIFPSLLSHLCKIVAH